MDIVYLRNLRVDTVIGLHPWERHIKQTLSVDVDLAWDIRPAAASDNIAHALDYQAISQRLIEFGANSQPRLIETMAEAMAQMILAEFSVPWLRLHQT